MSFQLGIPSAGPPRKRNVFFSFHYADIMRVNNVRMSQEFQGNALTGGGRSIQGFYDYSLWESRKTQGAEAIKRLIKDGVDRTSAVCVLIGTESWSRRWVRYEIALSVADGRGLLAIHLNNLASHQPPYQPHPLGVDPCAYMGLQTKSDGKAYLCEYKQDGWHWYDDHSAAVPIPKTMTSVNSANVTPLSATTFVYDWVRDGHAQIGSWIDTAAIRAGR